MEGALQQSNAIRLATISAWKELGACRACLSASQGYRRRSDQSAAQILNQLEQCKAFPDFNNYLAFICAQADSLPIEVGRARRVASACTTRPGPLLQHALLI